MLEGNKHKTIVFVYLPNLSSSALQLISNWWYLFDLWTFFVGEKSLWKWSIWQRHWGEPRPQLPFFDVKIMFLFTCCWLPIVKPSERSQRWLLLQPGLWDQYSHQSFRLSERWDSPSWHWIYLWRLLQRLRCYVVLGFLLFQQVIKNPQQVIQNGGFELNGGGDPGLDHWNKRGCQMSAEKWDVHQGVYSFHLFRKEMFNKASFFYLVKKEGVFYLFSSSFFRTCTFTKVLIFFILLARRCLPGCLLSFFSFSFSRKEMLTKVFIIPFFFFF